MNKKHLNSILIVLLLIIWGSVIYKYFGNKTIVIHPNAITNTPLNKANLTIVKDTFNLNIIAEDPFRISKKKALVKAVNTSISKNGSVKKKLPTTVNWPSISYYGFVKGEQKDTKLVLIKINNRLYRKRELNTINDVTIVKAYSDSITVSFNKNKKTIQKAHEKI